MKKKLGLDLGKSSIGWCLLSYNEEQKYEIIDMGVRLFKPGDKAERRRSRAARIQRRRRKLRLDLLSPSHTRKSQHVHLQLSECSL